MTQPAGQPLHIVKRITSSAIVTERGGTEATGKDAEQIDTMHEGVQRPSELRGTTYKIPSIGSYKHATYVTVNDLILNEGTKHQVARPFEVFINSKSMENFQWIVALTRIISAVFRKGGDVEFLVEELESVFDPGGGHWRGKKRIPSLVAEIGHVIRVHLQQISARAKAANNQQQLPALRAVKEREAPTLVEPQGERCAQCGSATVFREEGCKKCATCGDSECG